MLTTKMSSFLPNPEESQSSDASSFKVYRNSKKILLPRNLRPSEKTFEKIVAGRRSNRSFDNNPISLDAVSRLLYYGCGITGQEETDGNVICLRAAPSPGALFPLEIYIAANNVVGLKKRLYHYNVLEHSLELIEEGDASAVANSTLYPRIVASASVVIIITAIFHRVTRKYRERGYRFVLQESGHVAQNICLTATSIDLGSVVLGGFLDDELNGAIGLDGVNEASLYLVPVGTLRRRKITHRPAKS